jgi:hypothetical protein
MVQAFRPRLEPLLHTREHAGVVNNFLKKPLDKPVFVWYIIVVERGITKCKIYQKAQSPSEVTTVFGKQ